MELAERVLEQGETETTATPCRPDSQAGDDAAAEIERQVLAVPRLPTTTRPG
jgi:hypothetical protein